LRREKYVRYENLALEGRDGIRHEVEFISNVYPEGNHNVIQCNVRDVTERKRTEEAVRANEAEKALILDNVGDIIAYHDKNMRLVWANQAYLNGIGSITGTPARMEEVKGLHCYEAWKLTKPCIGCPVSVALRTGETNEAELSLENQPHWPATQGAWSIKASPVHDAQGNVIGAIEISRDITERKKAEALLHIKSTAVASAIAGIAISDLDGRISYVNAAWLHMHGHESDAEVRGTTPLQHVLNPADADAVVKAIQREGSWTGELVCRRRDGSHFAAELATNLMMDSTGRPMGMLASFQDITQRKQAEKKLRFFALAVESSSDAIGMSTPDGKHYYQNKSFDDLFGIVGENPPATLYVDEQVGREVFRTIMGGNPWAGEVKMRGKAGGLLDVSLRAYAIKDDAGKILGLVGVHDDITEHKRMEAEKGKLEDQFREAQKMESVGRLAGGVAHDFNNLLMGIMGYAELCREKIAPDHPIREYLDEITHDAERSAEITRQLLAFARKQTIAPKILNLNDAVAGMLKLLRRLIGEDIKMTWRPSSDLLRVRIDPSQVDQILANLCVNSRDSIAGVGEITLETGSIAVDADYCARHPEAIPGAYVFLAVSDNGCGMDKETLAQVFEPFFTTKCLGKGTGLGLATVYGIVKQNNGFVYAYSEPGKGTTFKIYLPEIAEETVATTVASKVEAPRGRGETILLVEDEKSLRVTCGAFLDALGYKVMVAETPGEALKMTAQHPGDLHVLLTDVVMPGMDGRQLAQRLGAVKPGIKVLFMSGYTATVIAQRGVLDDGVQFLSKPFTRDDLARKVREVLESD
jgi:PAS domain S-box-containing protein